MTVTDPAAPNVTSQTWTGHWHGFGPWLGSPSRYAQKGNRRPPNPVRPQADSDHAARYQEAAGEFVTSSLPRLVGDQFGQGQGVVHLLQQVAHAVRLRSAFLAENVVRAG
ncbi:hypothetical protein [Streptomyces sp. CA-106131]|uniref:hypothetical protein n=1 Tax=Streptomyces sp. CA-106131 TaxID=3240045 RepID=UPI003D8EC01F